MFKNVNRSEIINSELILSKFTQVDILAHYFNISALPVLINSPLRTDNKASFSIYSPDGNSVMFHDFATNESGDIFQLLSALWHIDYYSTLCKIYDELYLPINKFNTTKKQNKVTIKTQIEINVKTRNWEDYDFQFWKQFGINEKWLRFGDVYPISHIFFGDINKQNFISAEKYAYVYVERKDNIVSLKIYQPYSKKYKWISKHDSSVWDLWTKLPPNGKKLIITSSRKDALCLWANTGVPSICMQGEGYIPKPQIIDELKSRFEDIYIFFDNDFESDLNPGQTFARKICETYGFKNIYIPSYLKSKDPSDLYKNKGKDIFKQTIKNLIYYD